MSGLLVSPKFPSLKHVVIEFRVAKDWVLKVSCANRKLQRTNAMYFVLEEFTEVRERGVALKIVLREPLLCPDIDLEDEITSEDETSEEGSTEDEGDGVIRYSKMSTRRKREWREFSSKAKGVRELRGA